MWGWKWGVKYFLTRETWLSRPNRWVQSITLQSLVLTVLLAVNNNWCLFILQSTMLTRTVARLSRKGVWRIATLSLTREALPRKQSPDHCPITRRRRPLYNSVCMYCTVLYDWIYSVRTTYCPLSISPFVSKWRQQWLTVFYCPRQTVNASGILTAGWMKLEVAY